MGATGDNRYPRYPGATITLVFAVTAVQGEKEVLEGCEVLLTVEGKELELTVAPDGTVREAPQGVNAAQRLAVLCKAGAVVPVATVMSPLAPTV